MGLDKVKFEFIKRNILSFDKLTMMELGNQKVKNDLSRTKKTGKEFWSGLGCYHFSIDINGEDGAMSFDLSLPITYYDNFFDIITNITVSNYIKRYNICYDNINRFCRPGGIMIHCLPYKESKWNKTHLVDKQFYESMESKYNITLVDYKEYNKNSNGKLTLAAFKK